MNRISGWKLPLGFKFHWYICIELLHKDFGSRWGLPFELGAVFRICCLLDNESYFYLYLVLFSVLPLKYLHAYFNKSCNFPAGIYLHLFVLTQCLHWLFYLKQDKERKTWVQFIHKVNSFSLKQVFEFKVFLNAEGAWNFPSIKEILKSKVQIFSYLKP